VLGYAIRRTKDRAAAEEAVSETFLIAWRRLDAMPADALPWLLGVSPEGPGESAPRGRAQRPRRAAGAARGGRRPRPGDAVADLVADREAFAASFASLSAGDREVLALVNWDGLSASEAATVLDCTAATFYLRLHRARRRLLKELAAREHSFGERAAGLVPGRVADATEAR
jgi:RNA polymerase sigma-70 factor (ECF subfamily)